MAIFASRSDQLWSFALQLTEEEMKSQPFPQQEEHGRIIQTKYNQLVSNLSCLGDIIATMYEEEKLTQTEFEQIRNLQSTPIRANEELLSIIARKPRDVFDCFLSIVKHTNQLHLYQMLVSVDDTSDREKREGVLDHKDLIRRNFMWLSENMDTENGLITLLYQQNVLTVREREGIFCINDLFQKKEFLLVLLSKKSPEELVKFLEALEATNQGHLVKELRKRGGSPANPSTVISPVTTPKRICHNLLPKAVHKFVVANDQVRSSSKSIPPPKTLPKTLPKPKREQNLKPSRSSSKPVPIKPGTQSNSNKHYAKSVHNVARSTEKTVNFQRTQWGNCQARLEGIEYHLQTDIAVKVTQGSSAYLDRQEDSFKMCFRIILRECCQVRKEIVTENYEKNMELEELRKISSQYSTTITLNEVLRAQLNSIQQVLTSERLQWKKERMQLEGQISKLKTDSKTVTMEMKGSLDKSEYEKQCYKQERDKLNSRLASIENELQRSKEQFDKCTAEVISLRAESERLKKACDILRRGNGTVNDLEVQVLSSQEDNRDLKRQVKKIKRSSESAEEENLRPIYTRQNATVGGKALDNDRKVLEEELESGRHRNQDLEDKLGDAKALFEHFNRSPEGRTITSTNVCRQFLTSADEELAQRLQNEEYEKKLQWNREARKLARSDFKAAKEVHDQEEERLQRERYGFLLPQKTLAEEDEQVARLLQEEEGRNKEFVKCDDAKIAFEMQRKEIIEKIIIGKKPKSN